MKKVLGFAVVGLAVLSCMGIVMAQEAVKKEEGQKTKEVVLDVKVKEGTEDIVDVSTYGNKVFNHGADIVADPKFGPVMQFNGSDKWVEVPPSAPLKISGDITWEILYNIPADALIRHTIIGYGQPSAPPFMYIQPYGHDLVFEIMDSEKNSVTYGAGIASAAPPSGWHLVTLVRSGNAVLLYIDGEWILQRKNPKLGDISLGGNIYNIGREGRQEFYFKGMIAEVRIYNGALTEEEVIERAKSLSLSPQPLTE